MLTASSAALIMCLDNPRRQDFSRLCYQLHRERMGYAAPVAVVIPFIVKVSVGTQTDTEGQQPLVRWDVREQVTEQWQPAPIVHLPSMPGDISVDFATMVRPSHIREEHLLVNLFIRGMALPHNVHVERRRSDAFQLDDSGIGEVIIIN